MIAGDGILILGGGLAGLGAGLQLPGSLILEAKSHPGGHCYSHEKGGYFWDEGAHIFHSKDTELNETLLKGLDIHQVARSVVKNFWNGIWTDYPVQNSLRSLPLELRIEALVSMVNMQKDPVPVNNYRDWCLNSYGTVLTDQFYEIFTRKYWLCGASELATDWLGGRLIPPDFEKIAKGLFSEQSGKSGAVFSSFRYPKQGGFFRIYSGLYDKVQVRNNAKVIHIATKKKYVEMAGGLRLPYDQLISTLPMPELPLLLDSCPVEVREAALKLKHTSILCVNLVVRGVAPDVHWFYIYDQEIPAARVTVASGLSGMEKNASGKYQIQAEIFYNTQSPLDREMVSNRCLSQLSRILEFSVSTDIEFFDYFTVKYGYVVSDHCRASAVSVIRHWLEKNSIYSCGLYGRWEYMWSQDALKDGLNTGSKLAGGIHNGSGKDHLLSGASCLQ